MARNMPSTEAIPASKRTIGNAIINSGMASTSVLYFQVSWF